MGSDQAIAAEKDDTMSELERAEAEYRRLSTQVIYAGFEGDADKADRERLDKLGEELVRLTDPPFLRDDELAVEASARA